MKKAKSKAKKKIKTKAGSQPFQMAVAFNLGKDCPVGAEIQFVMGLDKVWPNLTQEEAINAVLDGLASRFEPKS